MQVIFNGESQDIDDKTSIADILERFKIERRQVAVEVNQEIVPRDELDGYVLHEGDRIEVVTLVGGG